MSQGGGMEGMPLLEQGAEEESKGHLWMGKLRLRQLLLSSPLFHPPSATATWKMRGAGGGKSPGPSWLPPAGPQVPASLLGGCWSVGAAGKLRPRFLLAWPLAGTPPPPAGCPQAALTGHMTPGIRQDLSLDP